MYRGDEFSIYRRVDHVEEMEEMEEISSCGQLHMRQRSESFATKNISKPLTENVEGQRPCTELMQKISSSKYQLEP